MQFVRARKGADPKKKTAKSVTLMVEEALKALKFDPANYAVFEIWDREARGIARGCEAIGLQGTKICVKVPSTVHRQELLFHKERLIQKVNQAMGKRVIYDVRFELEN